jgi:NAD(P)-dependent dehydrogenase (short-subunit alcohol dehydrogenase family)
MDPAHAPDLSHVIIMTGRYDIPPPSGHQGHQAAPPEIFFPGFAKAAHRDHYEPASLTADHYCGNSRNPCPACSASSAWPADPGTRPARALSSSSPTTLGAALLLTDPQSGYITGAVLPVDGGWTSH